MVKTLTITNFNGRLTRFSDGDINSGFAKYLTTWGANPFLKPGNLTWFEEPTQIDAAASTISDFIVAGKTRTESGLQKFYAVGSAGRLYKISVDNSSNPDLDSPALLTTLTENSPTYKLGTSLDFYGGKIIIGWDDRITKVDTDGANEADVGAFGASFPRVSAQFLGKLYISNGTNIAEVNSSLTLVSTGKLSPALPNDYVITSLNVTPDGNYLQIVASKVGLAKVFESTSPQETESSPINDSIIVYWNGTDNGATAANYYPGLNLTKAYVYGTDNYNLGYNWNGTGVFQGNERIASLPNVNSPYSQAVFPLGNLMGFATTEYDTVADVMKASFFAYGNYDAENPEGLFRLYRNVINETNAYNIPVAAPVSNLAFGQSYAGYTNNKIGTGKLYLSLQEATAASGNRSLGFFKWTYEPTGANNCVAGVYETQNQLFSKKIAVKEVRVYGEPWVANNSFTIDLIGSAGTSITNSSKTFTAGSTLTVGEDFAYYNPAIAPTYALGLRITNVGTVNNTITKVEIDYDDGGK